jgi:hypothetical protein
MWAWWRQVIGRILLDSLGDASLSVVGEALDALFDVYADEDMDTVFFGTLDALSVLQAHLPTLQQRVCLLLLACLIVFW